MTEPVRRGQGPWPSDNAEAVVEAWLNSRLSGVEASERSGMVRWLMEHVSSSSKGERLVWKYRWPESQLDRLALHADRLNEGEPIQHVLEESWFAGIHLKVTPDVLIPRPETEELVEAMTQRLNPHSDRVGRIVDWCTGSGCIALALKRRFPGASVEGWDVSPEAIQVARFNKRRAFVEVEFDVRDLFQDVPEGPGADAVVSNPPYIPRAEGSTMHLRVTKYEPELALFVPDDDPLCFYRVLESWCARGGLREDGWLGVECHTALVSDVAALLTSSGGWKHVEILSDLQGLPRHVVARRALP